MATPNRLRARREAHGLSQSALAAAAQLTRQSIGAIESARATPAVDVALRLARVLDTSVEELFGTGDAKDSLIAEACGALAPGRVALAEIGGRWVAHALTGNAMKVCADGIAATRPGGRVNVELVRPRTEIQQNLVLMGCAAGLSLLADRFSLSTGMGRCLWVSGSSTAALKALSKQQTHVAGVHLVDTRTGDFNLTDVRRHAGPEPLVLITFARWEVGLVTSPGNPYALKRGADLAQRGLRLVRREQGAGARRLLDRELRAAGITLDFDGGSHLQASGHLEVAQAIALGAADVGIATRDVAIAFGLTFVPLSEERYDLVLPRDALGLPHIQRLLDLMTAAAFRSELTSLGYDVSPCGERVAEVDAA